MSSNCVGHVVNCDIAYIHKCMRVKLRLSPVVLSTFFFKVASEKHLTPTSLHGPNPTNGPQNHVLALENYYETVCSLKQDLR